MGNKLSCLPKKKEKYKRPEQVVENEDVGPTVVTNQGNSKDVPGATTEYGNNRNENGRIDSSEYRGQNTNSGKKRNKKQADTDSESVDTSDSSTASDSSDNTGYQKSSTKAYKNKHGGTTLVSKKIIVGGNYTKISGDGATNMVLTINNGPSVKQKKEEKKPATRYEPYTAKTKKNFQRWRNDWIQDTTAGNFLYLNEASGGRLEGVDVGELKQLWQGSVCHIIYPGGSGSGFRIGPSDKNYICTARHVVTEIIGSGGSIFDQPTIAITSHLGKHSVFCVFNHTIDNYSPTNQDKFYFKEIIHFDDEETDTAILELKDSEVGSRLPEPFTTFNIPDPTEQFHLIGHPGGGKKKYCKSENIIDMVCPNTSNHVNKVRRWCADNNFACEPSQHNRLDNPARWLFHVASGFTKGASGCPGLVIRPPYDVMVVTVLLRGYPDGYYDDSLAPDVRFRVPKDFLVEQGANMEFVVKNMHAKAPLLCAEIFKFPVQ